MSRGSRKFNLYAAERLGSDSPEAPRAGRFPDMDVCDDVVWSAVPDLSELFVARRARPIDFPDIRRGAGEANQPIFIARM